jgi:hypothetical protein
MVKIPLYSGCGSLVWVLVPEDQPLHEAAAAGLIFVAPVDPVSKLDVGGDQPGKGADNGAAD